MVRPIYDEISQTTTLTCAVKPFPSGPLAASTDVLSVLRVLQPNRTGGFGLVSTQSENTSGRL